MHTKKIFPSEISLDTLNQFGKGCMIEHLDIKIIEIGDAHLIATMPVDHRTKQPMGLLHGGASVVLAESLGSYASGLVIDTAKQYPVGIEINANHIRSATDGLVYGKVKSIHLGKTIHVWNIKITNKDNQLISISRLTVAVLDRKR